MAPKKQTVKTTLLLEADLMDQLKQLSEAKGGLPLVRMIRAAIKDYIAKEQFLATHLPARRNDEVEMVMQSRVPPKRGAHK